MNEFVIKVGGSGSTKPPKEEDWVAQEINLMDNKISKLPDYPNCPLIALYLESNYDLAAIPPLFFQQMTLLHVLDLSNTSIKSLPKSLPKLVALKKLVLRGCLLFMELSPQVGKLNNLEELDLDGTQIVNLPINIGKLVKLKLLKVSFYGHISLSKRWQLQSNRVIQPETISNLSQKLTELSIDVDPSDNRWDDSVESIVKAISNSKGLRSLSLYLPEFQLLGYTSSLYPLLSCFRFIVGRPKRRIISRVPHQAEVEFRKWDKCLKFVNGDNIPDQITEVLKFSTSFFLDCHANTTNLSQFRTENMKMLKSCLLAECKKMETIIDESEHDPASSENLLESLQYLSIHYMKNLGSIWKGPVYYGCLCNLKFLALHTCPKLSNIFSLALLENFVNLEELIVEDCPQVTSLVSHVSVQPIPDIFLPSLKRLLLLYLPELVSISNGLFIAPRLERLGFYNCPKLKSLSKRELSSKTLKIIKGEPQWWEDIEWNDAEWGTRPDYLVHIFAPLNSEEDVMTQLAEDHGDVLEASIQNEGQQSADSKLVESFAQRNGQWSGNWTVAARSIPPPSLSLSSLAIPPRLNVSISRNYAEKPYKSLTSSSSSTPAKSSLFENLKRRDWNTFCQYLKNQRPPLSVSMFSGAHVIDFLRYLDQFGKTKVHNTSCLFFGRPDPPSPCPCPLRQAWSSLDALIGRLRSSYEDHGGKPETNPFGARAVSIYLREVQDSQGKARGISYREKRKRPDIKAPVIVYNAPNLERKRMEEQRRKEEETEDEQATSRKFVGTLVDMLQ